MAHKDDIRANTERNIVRVKNLVSIYRTHLAGTGSGRRPVASADVLRAATVLLHATLEDFLRDLARWKLPIAAADALADVPIHGSDGKATKFTLASLARFRGSSVDDVISDSVLEHLAQETYNNVSDVKKLLKAIGQDDTKVDPFADLLGNMMDRRHNIVHRADKNEATGVGHTRAKSISYQAVNSWITNAEKFVAKVLEDI